MISGNCFACYRLLIACVTVINAGVMLLPCQQSLYRHKNINLHLFISLFTYLLINTAARFKPRTAGEFQKYLNILQNYMIQQNDVDAQGKLRLLVLLLKIKLV